MAKDPEQKNPALIDESFFFLLKAIVLFDHKNQLGEVLGSKGSSLSLELFSLLLFFFSPIPVNGNNSLARV